MTTLHNMCWKLASLHYDVLHLLRPEVRGAIDEVLGIAQCCSSPVANDAPSQSTATL